MQAARKIKTVWRNSACLMLLNGLFKYKGSGLNDFRSVFEKKVLPNFLEVADHQSGSTGTDEKELLLVQRHDKSGFMVIYTLRPCVCVCVCVSLVPWVRG